MIDRVITHVGLICIGLMPKQIPTYSTYSYKAIKYVGNKSLLLFIN